MTRRSILTPTLNQVVGLSISTIQEIILVDIIREGEHIHLVLRVNFVLFVRILLGNFVVLFLHLVLLVVRHLLHTLHHTQQRLTVE